jgi:hypothetical protein
MNSIKREKQSYEEALLSANKLFDQDMSMLSDLSRLQTIMQRYSNLDPSKLEVNKANAVNNELKKAKQFK